MANESKTTHVVTHPSLYLAVAGAMQHIEKGTELTLTNAQAEAMAGKVEKIAIAKKLVVAIG